MILCYFWLQRSTKIRVDQRSLNQDNWMGAQSVEASSRLSISLPSIRKEFQCWTNEHSRANDSSLYVPYDRVGCFVKTITLLKILALWRVDVSPPRPQLSEPWMSPTKRPEVQSHVVINSGNFIEGSTAKSTNVAVGLFRTLHWPPSGSAWTLASSTTGIWAAQDIFHVLPRYTRPHRSGVGF